MNKNLNSLEKEILVEISRANNEYFTLIKNHLSILTIKSRKHTGVGLYVNFDYSTSTNGVVFNKNVHLGSGKLLYIDNLKYPLTYEVSITNGRISYLELVTNGDELWDGEYKIFKFKTDKGIPPQKPTD